MRQTYRQYLMEQAFQTDQFRNPALSSLQEDSDNPWLEESIHALYSRIIPTAPQILPATKSNDPKTYVCRFP